MTDCQEVPGVFRIRVCHISALFLVLGGLFVCCFVLFLNDQINIVEELKRKNLIV